MKRWQTHLGVVVLVVMVTAMLLSMTLPASAQGAARERKIVVFQDWVVNEAAQGALVRGVGGYVIKPLPLLNGMAVSLPPMAAGALLGRPEVLRVDDDLIIYAIGPVTLAAKPAGVGKPPPQPQPPQTTPWGIARVDAPLASPYSTGGPVKLAVVDTGIKLNHPDLQANIAGGINAIRPSRSPNDDNGHGTHVAGIAGAVDNAIGVVGVAPQVRLYAVKVLSKSGSGFLSDVIEGLTWCIDNGIQVVNMSLGANSDNLSFHQAVTAVYNAGIVQVAAAGNSGGPLVSYPAAYPEVIAVSATDSADDLAWFSSWGDAVDLAAPGVSIYSTWYDGYYTTLSGTSMSSPHVAGVAALRLALYPLQTPDQVKAALEASATDLGDPGWDPFFGAGLANALGAVTAP